MILKASQRSNGVKLAAHLLNDKDNDHVYIYDVSGFLTDDVTSAFDEIEAVSKGTRCQQPFFSLSLSPPQDAKATEQDFDAAIQRTEQALNLSNQPRVVIFHEKNGRRHAHTVWSRIDSKSMKAITMSFFKEKLTNLSRELYLEHDWRMPEGLVDRSRRNPLNYNLEELQQAKRINQSPKAVKATLKGCWTTTQDKTGFAQALERKGYYLARGNRRGYVAVDWQGEVFSLSRWLNVKHKELSARLGSPEQLPAVESVNQQIETLLTRQVRQQLQTINTDYDKQYTRWHAKAHQLTEIHRHERSQLEKLQSQRWQKERDKRKSRFQSGIKGLWRWITGEHQQLQRRNELETLYSQQRDQKERDELIFSHLQSRQQLQQGFEAVREQQRQALMSYREKLAIYGNKHEVRIKDEFDRIDEEQAYRQTTRSWGLEL